MRVRWYARRISRASTAAMAALVLIGLGPGTVSASTCQGWTVLKPPSPGPEALLSSVAAVSSSHAWAVGQYANKHRGESTLLVRWAPRGRQVPTPNPGGLAGGNYLSAVAATSARNAWAVGGGRGLLILHWNGIEWKQVLSPRPPGSSLSGVAATSSSNAWAVGSDTSGSLILHWNGTSWKQVPSPPGIGLSAVTATSLTNAWAVGCVEIYGCNDNAAPGQRIVIVHWNGATWKRVPSPNPAGYPNLDFLYGVAATSATNAWAVGYYTQGAGDQTLILHWNGTRWQQVPSPNPDSFFSILSAVSAVSTDNVWAAGAAGAGYLIAHWNGTRWQQVSTPSPDPGTWGELLGLAATSPGSIWAVGFSEDQAGHQYTLALRRCSTAGT